MAVTITIRNVPDEVRARLAVRAAQSGQSMQEYLRSELTVLASTPSAAEAIARARLNAQSYPNIGDADILSALDAARR